jgi:hypothetical protein
VLVARGARPAGVPGDVAVVRSLAELTQLGP